MFLQQKAPKMFIIAITDKVAVLEFITGIHIKRWSLINQFAR